MSAPAALRRILYVEDDADIRTVATLALEVVGGFMLRPCDSGRAALIESTQFAADLILLDVMMPDMDGPTTLARLRSQPATADTPVIFMTARLQASDQASYHALGAIGVIAKPFDPMQLAQQVRRLWQQWQQDRGRPSPSE